MATAKEIQEMSDKFNGLKQELVSVEQWFDAELLKWIEDKIAKGEMESVNRFRNFELLVVSSAYAVFVAPEETIWNGDTNDLVHTNVAKIAVPLIFMAGEAKN